MPRPGSGRGEPEAAGSGGSTCARMTRKAIPAAAVEMRRWIRSGSGGGAPPRARRPRRRPGGRFRKLPPSDDDEDLSGQAQGQRELRREERAVQAPQDGCRNAQDAARDDGRRVRVDDASHPRKPSRNTAATQAPSATRTLTNQGESSPEGPAVPPPARGSASHPRSRSPSDSSRARTARSDGRSPLMSVPPPGVSPRTASPRPAATRQPDPPRSRP